VRFLGGKALPLKAGGKYQRLVVCVVHTRCPLWLTEIRAGTPTARKSESHSMGHHFGPNDPGAGLQSSRIAGLQDDELDYEYAVPDKVPLANDNSAHMSVALEKRSAESSTLANLREQPTMMAAQRDVFLSDEDNKLANLREQQAMMSAPRDIISSSQAPKPNFDVQGHTADTFGGGWRIQGSWSKLG